MSIRDELISFIKNIETVDAGYKSWGKVSVQKITVRDGQNTYSTTSLKENDISPLSLMTEEDKMLAAIFATRKHINCIMITRQEYGSTLKEEVPPILDDQAQLLGVSIKVAKNNTVSAVLKALHSRYAAVDSDGRCVCIGGTVEDAYIAAQLLEKTAKAFTEAKYIGGAKSINRLEAWAMQMYYQFKYAKEAKKNR
ncbi:MAG: transporter [Bacteroidetes bacterium]|nr:transporter [Bacteroidota bacterium]